MATKNRYAIYLPNDGKGTAMEIFRPGGMGDSTEPYGDRTVVYVAGESGKFIPYDVEEGAPGGQPDVQFNFFEKKELTFFEEMATKQETFNMQRRYTECGSLDNPTAWSRIWHFAEGRITNRTTMGAPMLRADGTLVEANVTASFLANIDVTDVGLSSLTTTEAENLNAITGLSDIEISCGGSYPGADKLLFAVANAAAAGTANVLYSTNGGSTWANITADPGGTDEHLGVIDCRPYGDYVRVVVGLASAGATDLEVYYADVDLAAPASATWTTVTVEATNTDSSTALYWSEFSRMYLGTSGGDVFVSTDQAATWTKVYSPGNQVNGFTRARNGDVYAIGASGDLAIEKNNNQGTFSALTGPDSNAFTAIASAYDETLFLASDTSIWRTADPEPSSAGAWSEKKNFGTGYSPISINLEGQSKLENGSSDLLRVVLDHATAGQVWQSMDGGATWEQITALSNAGYNDAYWSTFGNKAFLVGDATGGAAVIQLMA